MKKYIFELQLQHTIKMWYGVFKNYFQNIKPTCWYNHRRACKKIIASRYIRFVWIEKNNPC